MKSILPVVSVTLISLLVAVLASSKPKPKFDPVDPDGLLPIHSLPGCIRWCMKHETYTALWFNIWTITQREWCSQELNIVRHHWRQKRFVPCARQRCPWDVTNATDMNAWQDSFCRPYYD
ncbi:uncharacterized protein CTRU02_204057 [Colletotrichum truncatum]|uniref:Uncharacterized protein n=1 Tax=Colletotrichum truncatum TaxID=5467 RepID=A0ACC3ZAW0_COLTU|nr:uncharacterized protein CTRU02_13652 [Colletotrichum truncatum]KAF6783185.1 hypothetical protein CTRU02_13652 [Colletotrichum truncatum]